MAIGSNIESLTKSMAAAGFDTQYMADDPSLALFSAGPYAACVVEAVIKEILSDASGDIDLAGADIVISVSRGAKDQAGIDFVKGLANDFGAGFGSSRAMRDSQNLTGRARRIFAVVPAVEECGWKRPSANGLILRGQKK